MRYNGFMTDRKKITFWLAIFMCISVFAAFWLGYSDNGPKTLFGKTVSASAH